MRKLSLLTAICVGALGLMTSAAYADNPKCVGSNPPNIQVWDITTSSGVAWDVATVTGQNVSCNISETNKSTWPAKSVVYVPRFAYIAPTPQGGPIPQDAVVGWSKATTVVSLFSAPGVWLQDSELPVLAKPNDNVSGGKGEELCGPSLCHALYQGKLEVTSNLSVWTWVSVEGSQQDGFTFKLNPVESNSQYIDASLGAVLPMQICAHVQASAYRPGDHCDDPNRNLVNLRNGPAGTYFFGLRVYRRDGSSDTVLCRGGWDKPLGGPIPPGRTIEHAPSDCSLAPQFSGPHGPHSGPIRRAPATRP